MQHRLNLTLKQADGILIHSVMHLRRYAREAQMALWGVLHVSPNVPPRVFSDGKGVGPNEN